MTIKFKNISISIPLFLSRLKKGRERVGLRGMFSAFRGKKRGRAALPFLFELLAAPPYPLH
jgi:hypothetical protein